MIDRDQPSERHERLDEALKANPFTSLIHKYRRQDTTSQEVLDKLYLDLGSLGPLASVQAQLTENPAYTSVFRYDPYSITMMGQSGCFSNRVSMGAATASAHVFRELTYQDIHVLRTDDETLVVIDRPSTILKPGHPAIESDEPTVLFTSKMFDDISAFFGTHKKPDEFQLGLVISHGDGAISTQPRPDLVSSRMMDHYLHLTLASANAKND
jgi:hypothetical protein